MIQTLEVKPSTVLSQLSSVHTDPEMLQETRVELKPEASGVHLHSKYKICNSTQLCQQSKKVTQTQVIQMSVFL